MIKSTLLVASLFLIFATNAKAQSADVKEWTFLVYMNADNNLWQYGQMNMAEMERIGSSPQVNVVVEEDPEPQGMPTTRYFVTQNPNAQPGTVTSKVLQQLGETDMGDYKHLAEFITWGVKNFPAKHYALVIWNHGAGWEGVSYDDNPSDYMTIPNLSLALKTANQAIVPLQQSRGLYAGGPVIDIINFDACLMSAMEVAYELKDQAKILVGSQFLEPGEGEDYTTLLKPLEANPAMSPADFAQVMVYQYALRYAQKGDGINYVAIDLSKMNGFTQMFSQVADNHISAPGDVQSKLKAAYMNNDFQGDLIGGMQAAQQISTNAADNPLTTSLDHLVQMYGYPAESAKSVDVSRDSTGTNKIYHVVRYYPGVLHFRYSNNLNWQTVPLTRLSNGSYHAVVRAAIGGAQLQYTVSRTTMQGTPNPGPLSVEASSVLMREGNDPIVYHNKFPVTSPLIADAYNMATKGAHGMTMYFFAGALQKKQNRGGQSALFNQYMQLAFARTGAPSWTRFFGN